MSRAEEVLIRIRTVQAMPDEMPEVMELQSDGTLTRFPDHMELSYVESEVTGLEGVRTTFAVYGTERVELIRDGEKLKNRMTFQLGKKTDSLYDVGFGALLITVGATRLEIDPSSRRFTVEYTVEVEHTLMGTNTYEVTYRAKE